MDREMPEIPEAGYTAQSLEEHNNKSLDTILSLARTDPTFRKRLLEKPKEVADEIGLLYPPGYQIMAIDLPKNTMPIIVPPLSDLS